MMSQDRDAVSATPATLFSLAAAMVFAPFLAMASALESDPHVVDATFNGGQISIIDYNANLSQTAGPGRPYLARLADGKVAVASAIVPPGGTSRNAVGLAILDLFGSVHVYDTRWNFDGNTFGSISIRDIVVHSGNIYVLAAVPSNPSVNLVLRWNEIAEFYGFSYLDVPGDGYVQAAIGMVATEGFGELAVVGSQSVTSGGTQRSQLVSWRLPVAGIGDGTVSAGTTMTLPGCGFADDCTPFAFVQSRDSNSGTGFDRYYLSVKRRVSGTVLTSSSLFRLTNPVLVPDPTWTPVVVEFTNPAPIYSLPRTIAINGSAAADEVFLVAAVQDCVNTAGVARISHGGGSVSESLLFGGTLPRPPCATPQREDNPFGATYAQGRLAIVGRTGLNNTDAQETQGFLAIVDRNLNLSEFRPVTYPLSPPTERASALFDVIPTSDGRFTVGGTATYRTNHPDPTLRGKSAATALQFRADRIFGYGFNP